MRVFFILILYIFSSFFSNCFAQTFEIDKIIAIVNNQVILNSDLNQFLFYLRKEHNITQVPLKINFLKDKILEKLIIDTLILEEANKFNIKITDDQVDVMFRKIAFKNNISLNEFKKYIILNNTNDFFTYEDYVKNIKKLLTIQILQDYILKNKIHISDKEIYYLLSQKIKKQNELKKINLHFIMLPVSNKDSYKRIENKKILINHLFKTINNNANFGYFYKSFKKNKNIFLSGNISFKSLKSLRKLFSNKLNIVRKNQVLGPILGKKGLYIMKVNNIQNNSIDNVITEFHIQHCLIRPSIILNNIQAKKDIFSIYNHIKEKHYSFEYAVKNLSYDVYSPYQKGDLGWVSNKIFNNSFKNILKNLRNNEISKPIKSNVGWHIIKLLERRQIDQKWRLEKEKIYQTLLQSKIKTAKNNWLKKLQKSSYVNIFGY